MSGWEKALEITKIGTMPVNFMATVGWCQRFIEKHNLLVPWWSHIVQKLPTDFENNLQDFQEIRPWNTIEYNLSDIRNLEQIPMSFDLSYAQTRDLNENDL